MLGELLTTPFPIRGVHQPPAWSIPRIPSAIGMDCQSDAAEWVYFTNKLSRSCERIRSTLAWFLETSHCVQYYTHYTWYGDPRMLALLALLGFSEMSRPR